MLDENTATPAPEPAAPQAAIEDLGSLHDALDIGEAMADAALESIADEVAASQPAPPAKDDKILVGPGVYATVRDCLKAAHEVRPRHSLCGGKGWRRRAGTRWLCDCGVERIKAKVARAMASPLEQERKNTPIISSEERERESARRKIAGWRNEIASLREKMQERSIRNAEMVAALERQAGDAEADARVDDRNVEACSVGIAAREGEIYVWERAIANARSEIVALAKDREKFTVSAAEHREQAEDHRAQVDPTKRKLPKSNEGALERIRALDAQVNLRLAKHPELRNGSAPLPAVVVEEATQRTETTS